MCTFLSSGAHQFYAVLHTWPALLVDLVGRFWGILIVIDSIWSKCRNQFMLSKGYNTRGKEKDKAKNYDNTQMGI